MTASTGHRRRRRLLRSVEAMIPAVVGTVAAVVLTCAFVIFWIEAPNASIVSRLFSSVNLFTGTYMPQEGQPPIPSRAVATVGLGALAVTFTAALTALFSLTWRTREWLRARRAGSELVVIGSGTPAAEILRSHQGTAARGLLLVTGARDGAAAVAARGHAATMLADLDALTSDDAAGLRRRGGTVAVATDDDALNIGIADGLTRHPLSGAGKVMAIVTHPLLAEELRPPVIAGGLRMPYGISCPAENLAEQVCHHLDQFLTEDAALRSAGHGTVVIEGDGGPTAQTVETWARRFTWSRAFLRNDSGNVPLLEMSERTEADAAGPVIRIYVGEDLAETAARTLRGLRNNRNQECRLISVTSARLLPNAQAPGVIAVDARSAAWDRRLVFDDIAEQWGRVYHSVYGVLFGNSTDWASVHTGREGQSSVAAGQFMLRVLADHGFHLVKSERRPGVPDFSAAELTSMAAAEHEEWRLNRTYRDLDDRMVSVVRPGSPYDRPWIDLDETARLDNEALVRCTVPALAALFGYEVCRIPVGVGAEIIASAGSARG